MGTMAREFVRATLMAGVAAALILGGAAVLIAIAVRL